MISKFFEYAGVLLAMLLCTGIIRWVLTWVFPMTKTTASTVAFLTMVGLTVLAYLNKED